MQPLLLTPGPLTTSDATRQALTRDWGSRDPAFVAMIKRVRESITRVVADGGYTTVPMQGSGTFSVEAMVGTFVPRDGILVVLVNGAYGRRIVEIATRIDRHVHAIETPEDTPVDTARLDALLGGLPSPVHVAMVYCETTTGLRNPVEEVAATVRRHDGRLLIDAMSAFGALPLSAEKIGFDAVAASSNKCLEGVPGLGFVICNVAALERCAGNAHSVSLDLHAQWQRLEVDGQFRFTPPTHVLAALDAALEQHRAEGGTAGRGARYTENCRRLVSGLRELGLRTYLKDEVQAPIIVTLHAPTDPRWDFGRFYDALIARGYAIYPGKLTAADTFRVGCIGQVYPENVDAFVKVVGEVFRELGVRTPRA